MFIIYTLQINSISQPTQLHYQKDNFLFNDEGFFSNSVLIIENRIIILM